MKSNKSISDELTPLTPGKRLKFIRQKIIKHNQNQFCQDGIIRSGTLKSIESERMKIGDKISDKIIHKLTLEGIKCSADIFINNDSDCLLDISISRKEIIGSSMAKLEDIRRKTQELIPIEVSDNYFEPLIPIGTTLLGYEISNKEIINLNKTLCFIKGEKSGLFLLSYNNNESITAETPLQKKSISSGILDFCTVFIIEIIYLG